jgi:hypothetical protein
MTSELCGKKNLRLSQHLPELAEENREKSQPEKRAPWPRLLSMLPDMKQPIFYSV